MQLKSAQYLLLSLFCQKLFCKLSYRTTLSIIKLETNSTSLEITHDMDMVLYCNLKGVMS